MSQQEIDQLRAEIERIDRAIDALFWLAIVVVGLLTPLILLLIPTTW